MPFPYEEFDLSDVRTYPLDSRRSKARVEDFARPVAPRATFKEWFDSLPAILGAQDVRRVVDAIVAARRRGAGVIWGIGAHVIKTGVSPVLIDLMRRGYVSALAMNGAGIIHDFEVALAGATSEDVDEALGPGRFGMAEETGRLLNEIVVKAAQDDWGSVRRSGAICRPPPRDTGIAVCGRCRRIGHSGHRPRGPRHRHHPHAPAGVRGSDWRREPARLPLLHLVRGAAAGRRLHELRIGRHPARGVPQGRRPGAQSRRRL